MSNLRPNSRAIRYVSVWGGASQRLTAPWVVVAEQVPAPVVARGLLWRLHGAVLHAEHGRGGLLRPARHGKCAEGPNPTLIIQAKVKAKHRL
jgi:hypothetical protein